MEQTKFVTFCKHLFPTAKEHVDPHVMTLCGLSILRFYDHQFRTTMAADPFKKYSGEKSAFVKPETHMVLYVKLLVA